MKMEATPTAGPSGIQQPRRRKPLTQEEKEMIRKVFEGLTTRTSHVTAAMDRCAVLTGVSLRSVQRVLKEAQRSGQLQPPQTHTRGRKKFQINEEEKEIIRRIVHSSYLQSTIPTLSSVLMKIRDNKELPQMCRETLRRVLCDLHFHYAKRCRKSGLIEKPEIVLWRRKYLRSIRVFRAEKRKIYYLDETCVNVSLMAPSAKEQSLIVIHIGSDTGFLEKAALVIVLQKSGDYYQHINADIFERWFKGILQRLERNAVIVMDNAFYHNRKLESIPTMKTKKIDVQQWLRMKGIPFFDDMVKAELIQQRYERNEYVIDSMAHIHDITILRLPPYHSELNPIGRIWAIIKAEIEITRLNAAVKVVDVQESLKTAIQQVQPLHWQKAIERISNIEKEMWKLDEMIEQILEPFICRIVSNNTSDSENDVNGMESKVS